MGYSKTNGGETILSVTINKRFMENTSFWKINYDIFSGTLTFAAIILALYLAELFIDENPAEFDKIVLLVILSIGAVLFSHLFIKIRTIRRFNRLELSRIALYGIIGFISISVMMFAVTLGQNFTSKYAVVQPGSILSAKSLALFYVSIAAIFEENLRFAGLRYIEFAMERSSTIPIPNVVVSIVVVNFIWTAYHIRSYVNAGAMAWIGLYLAGVIISVFMMWSENLATAMLIHLAWNIMVVL